MHIIIAVLHRPTEPTGVCRHAANLARCLAQTDAVTHITLVTGAWQQHYFQDDFLAGQEKITVLGVDIKNTSVSRNIWFLFGLPKLVKRLQPDLVHLSFPLPFLRWLFPCPVVATIHDLYPYKIPDNFGLINAFFNKSFLWECIWSSDALTCVSQATLADIETYFPGISKVKQVKVIYNIVDFTEVAAIPPQALQAEIDRPFILCVGQHRKNKNFNLAIDAFAALMQEGKLNPETRSIIIGSAGPETDNLVRSIEQHGLVASIIMLSAISDRELFWLYQNCDLVVIPSSAEGFCLPLVEALYFSCKVVCSDIPIFREIGNSNCMYFDLEGDPVKNVVPVIEKALNTDISEDRYDFSRFSQREIAALYLNFYLDSIGGKHKQISQK